jgi:hypothetical protein
MLKANNSAPSFAYFLSQSGAVFMFPSILVDEENLEHETFTRERTQKHSTTAQHALSLLYLSGVNVFRPALPTLRSSRKH